MKKILMVLTSHAKLGDTGKATGFWLEEDMLTAKGGTFSRAADWQPYAVSDGLLITGQNPASSDPVAKALLKQLG